MTAISKAFVDAADTAVDPDSPLDAPLITGFRDSLRNLREWLGASYYAGAVQDHNHDGTNSAAVQIGANYLRNGSFENGVAGWSQTNYAGGAQAIDTTHALDGANCLAITSTVLANGGGYAQTSEFEPVVAGRSYFFRGNLFASIANVSSKAECVWFDSTKTQISIATIYSATATPTAAADFSNSIIAPTNAKYKQLRITGGVPGSGSAVGTVYFDGLIAAILPISDAVAASTFFVSAPDGIPAYASYNGPSPAKVREWIVARNGTYQIRTWLYTSNIGDRVYGQVYKNGYAVGAVNSTVSTSGVSFDEQFSLQAGDKIQIYMWAAGTGTATYGSGQLGEASPQYAVRSI